MRSVNTGRLLLALALRHGTRAASTRKLVSWVLPRTATGSSPPPWEAVVEWTDHTLGKCPPGDGEAGLARLVAEDLGELLPHAARMAAGELRLWADPAQALDAALESACAALRAAGVPLERPRLFLVPAFPAPYDHPRLTAVSLDRADAEALGARPGIYVREDRTSPLVTELAVAHVLVHVALGARSPEALGRGLEEGLGELLGGLHAGAQALAPGAAEAAYAGLRLTDTLCTAREEVLAQTRAAALLHRRHGLAGIAALVAGGRGAVKRAEAALRRGALDDVELERAPPDPELEARLERLLEARGRPLGVTPLAYHLARILGPGGDLVSAAAELRVSLDRAREASRELTEGPFLAVLDGRGRVLASDLPQALASGELRYTVPPPAPWGGG